MNATRTTAILFTALLAFGANAHPPAADGSHKHDVQPPPSAKDGTTYEQFMDYLSSDDCYWPSFRRSPEFMLCPNRFGIDTDYWHVRALGDRGRSFWSLIPKHWQFTQDDQMIGVEVQEHDGCEATERLTGTYPEPRSCVSENPRYLLSITFAVPISAEGEPLNDRIFYSTRSGKALDSDGILEEIEYLLGLIMVADGGSGVWCEIPVNETVHWRGYGRWVHSDDGSPFTIETQCHPYRVN